MDGALQGVRVLDMSDSIAGQFCGRMLADYGADVTLVEPPGGSALRQSGPFRQDGRESLLFFHNNTGKLSITLDANSAAGRRLLLRLAGTADAVIAGPEVDAAQLRERNPDCVVATVSGFGEDGPYRDWQGTEMIYQALGGIMRRNGDPTREPLYGCGDRASYGAGVAAYISVLAALFARPRAGAGQHVAVDVAETTASMANPFVTQYLYSGIEEPRTRRMPFARVRCRDGWVGVWLHVHLWKALCEAIGLPDLAPDPRFANPKDRLDNWSSFVALLQEHVTDWNADDLLAPVQARKIVAARAYSLVELTRACPHLDVRGYWEEIETPEGPRPALGPQFRMSATPRRKPTAPPEPGSSNARVYAELGLSPQDIAALRAEGSI